MVELNLDLPPTPPSLLSNGPPPAAQPGRSDAHSRSLSMDADFFDGLGLDGQTVAAAGMAEGSTRPKHRHSNSMDGYSSATSSEMDLGAKKAMAADRLTELALLDPKRAKRILANRQSAARSKERKIHYTSELERKVQTLQTEATTLSAQITLLQRDTAGLTAENKELKLKLQAMEQQTHLRDALNEALRNELQRLKIASGQIPSNGDNGGLSSQVSSSPPSFHYFANHQAQQQQPLSSPNDPRLNGLLSQPRFQDFNQRER
ncbi:VIRE2-interacting protein 1 [Perilla frutescens var. frutescens]|nr:VIRE2-interacting protein 1 [Perilla frutescens var. frutescens]